MRKSDLIVTGLGTVVSGIGLSQLPKKWGYFALGLGAAHIALGLLDATVIEKK